MHPKLLRYRYKLFRYRAVEQRLAARPGVRRLLDIGCGDGENLIRFRHLPARLFGLEVSWPRLQTARRLGLAVLQGNGTQLPYPDKAFEFIYVAHVLHHVAEHGRLLAEARRCLAPNGTLFVVETVTDNPLLRLARRLHPVWRGDKVEAGWDFAELRQQLRTAGFQIVESGRYNILFWLWEMAPLAFWPLEIFTPLFVYLDLLLGRHFSEYAAHAYFVLTEESP